MSAIIREPIATPVLVVERGILESNLREMADLAAARGVELWPHAKTHRMPALASLQLEHGAAGLCVAKLGEAEGFADAGARRILVAYPVVGHDKARRALALAERIDLTLGTDSLEGATALARVFADAGRRARVMLAVDTGLGREGVLPRDAPALAARLAGLDGLELVGLYTHEGSAYAAADPADLDRRARAAAESMVAVAERIRAAGIPLEHVSLGCSASARAVLDVPGVTQVRPGIYAVNDLGQIALGVATEATTAIRVVATVVSRAAADRGCLDAGSKALGADLLLASAYRDEFPGYGLVVGHPGWVIEKLSEEHGWLRWTSEDEPTPLPVGERVEIIPTHACVAFAALRRATVVEDGRAVGTWDALGPGSSE